MRVLVTGASGFVGRALVERLARDPALHVRAASRGNASAAPSNVERVKVGDLEASTDWRAAVMDVDVVIHAAARVHVMRDSAVDPLSEFRRVNVEGTLSLARQAAAAGVRRFVFISSIKVNGDGTSDGRPYTPADLPAPLEAYGISKAEAEQGLFEIARDRGMELVVVRPVLVYGPGVKANFRAMLHALERHVPLPLGAVHNRRSLVALDNLVDLIIRCLSHPAAVGQTFLVSDGDDLSTPELLRRAARAMDKRAYLIPVPVPLLTAAAILSGRRSMLRRLCGSLTVDITKTRELLDWTPPVRVDDALRSTVQSLRQGK